MSQPGSHTTDSKFQVVEGVVVRKVGDETVLVDLDDEVYYSLNPTGSLAWQHLSAGEPLGDVVGAVVQAFDVDAGVASADLSTLIADLVEARLLQPA